MEKDQGTRGALYAVGAYTLWGIAPLYFKQLTHIPAYEILTHRVIWSFLLLLVLAALRPLAVPDEGRYGEIGRWMLQSYWCY